MKAGGLDFIVVALPRSGTTWLSNLLTTERSLCIHDPFYYGEPETWPHDGRRRGICCTVAYVIPGFIESCACPVVVLERDPADCDKSMAALGWPATTLVLDKFNALPWPRVPFADLWDEDKVQLLWDYLLPGLIFDRIRYRLLRDMQVQPYMPTWKPDAAVSQTLATFIGA